MPTYLLDASGLCKRYFVNETGADLIHALFDDATSTRYLLNIGILEILNAIYRVHREGYLTEAERDVLVAALFEDIANDTLRVISVRDYHIFNAESILPSLQAMSIVRKRPGPIDALLIACARQLDLPDLILVSADRDLNALAHQFDILTFDPENPLSPLA